MHQKQNNQVSGGGAERASESNSRHPANGVPYITSPTHSTPHDCPACASALASKVSGAYISHCMQCRARYLARSPVRHASVSAGYMTDEYKQALEKEFGETWAVHMPEIRRWARHYGR